MAKKTLTKEEELAQRFDETIAKVGKHQRSAKQDAASQSKLVSQKKLFRHRLEKYYRAVDELANSGMAGYQEWITSFMEIVKTNREMSNALKAYWPILWQEDIKPVLTQLVITPLGNFLWKSSCKDLDGVNIPQINYEIDMDKSGKINSLEPTIHGMTLKDFYESNSQALKPNELIDAKNLAQEFSDQFKTGFGAWLRTKGYEYHPADGRVEPTGGANAFSPEVFKELNAAPDETLDDYLSGRFNNLEIHATPKIR